MIPRLPIEVSAWGCLIGAAALLLVPLKLLAYAFLAAAVHECAHLAALWFCGAKVQRILICFGGAVIKSAPLPPLQELLCAAAGPAGSFLCLSVLRHFPLLALFGCIQGFYNLLPVYPLDGGRILHCLFQLIFPGSADKLSGILSQMVVGLVLGICVFLFIRTQRGLFLLLGGYFLFTASHS